MDALNSRLAQLGVQIPEILCPAHAVDLEKWAVVACDQWTQDRTYWEKVDGFVGDAPSTLRIIYPEVYLADGDEAQRIDDIHQTMRKYLADKAVFAPPANAGVFVEREFKHGTRRGFVLAIDLEKYDWRRESVSLIRATEETIESRLPQRMRVRAGAPLECPHILMLVDDQKNILMSLFEKLLRGAPYAYQSPLMTGGGSIQGRFVYRRNDWGFIADMLQHFYRNSVTNFGEKNAFLFAVGDGNHSLAAAKNIWEQYKTEHAGEPNLEQHNARYVLAEIMSLYDTSLEFEPIHRVLFNTGSNELLDALRKNRVFHERPVGSAEELQNLVCEADAQTNRYGIIFQDGCALFESKDKKTATVDMEPFLQEFIHDKTGASIDYLHGVDELLRVAKSRPDAVGIMLPPFHKEGLFKTLAEHGPLPRKSFSMGSAEEKRFYLECRKLFV